MKKALLFLLLFPAVFAQAQSLKEALYGGKLKNQPGTVIRKGEDLSTKIDTTSRKAAPDSAIASTAPLGQEPAAPAAPAAPPATAVAGAKKNDSVPAATTETGAPVADTAPMGAPATVAEPAAAETAPADNKPKDNNAAWKDYVNEVAKSVKTEVLSNKKIKKGDYNVLILYVIETDGQVTINDVSVSPENGFLQQHLKSRFVDTPRLEPVLSGSGTPRKANKRYSFNLTKE
ncbi:hypothetical protein V9K67_09230 [Paraflavisolibacter sp. H34]|uniref:hypothetical protein n=1 Tax=Huijunlia imazamoxiresistens TaxID=3127457 RepID=UPI003016441F